MSLEIVTYCERCGDEVESREVDGVALILPCKCCARRPTLDAPVPTEPGWYWARIKGEPVVEMVEVSDAREGCLWGSARGYWYGLPNWDRWSHRIEKPEVQP